VEPIRVHLVAAKHVMRYLKDTLDYGLYYTQDHEFGLYGYTDSYWVGSASAMTLWKIRKKSSISLSTTEEEYIETCSTSCESIWL